MFHQRLAEGKLGESIIATWLKSRGFNILPIYEKEIDEGKGPTVFSADGRDIIAPDLLVFNNEKIFWIEAKHKEAFTLYRKTNEFMTGIDLKHYEDYLRISKLVDWPVWLMFLQKGGTAKDSPKSNSGFYGQSLQNLDKTIHHYSYNWGDTGMVYWSENVLIRIADYDSKAKIIQS